jgi:hypothetical protein
MPELQEGFGFPARWGTSSFFCDVRDFLDQNLPEKWIGYGGSKE